MVRPKTIKGPTPGKQRSATALANLRLAGGEKVCAMLPPPTYQNLIKIRTAHGLNATDAMILAIDRVAARIKK